MATSTWLATLAPSPGVGALFILIGALYGILVAAVATSVRGRGVRVAYSRKIFHFGIFTGAAVVHAFAGLPGTNAYGSAVAAVVLFAVARGDGFGFYEALARDKDRPRRTLFIVVPLVTTAVGGLLSALLTGPCAAVGYLVAGWGDAVGEPAGARWGRHAYRVPSLRGVPATRSVEGSAAVLAVSWLAASGALLALGAPPARALAVGAPLALAATVVEALSPHGTDNLTVQMVASLLAYWLLGGPPG